MGGGDLNFFFIGGNIKAKVKIIVHGLATVHPQPLKDSFGHSFNFRDFGANCIFI